MTERDFRELVLSIFREHLDAWMRVGLHGHAFDVGFGGGRGRIPVRVQAHRVIVPDARGEHTVPAWTVEVSGVGHLYRMLGPTLAAEVLRRRVPTEAAAVRTAFAEVV